MQAGEASNWGNLGREPGGKVEIKTSIKKNYTHASEHQKNEWGVNTITKREKT